jgi:hypothetical protein
VQDLLPSTSKEKVDKERKQVQELCGYMKSDGVSIGCLYTDAAFWFFRFDAEADRLEISPCIMASQTSPITSVGAILYAGNLAMTATSAGNALDPTPPPVFSCDLLPSSSPQLLINPEALLNARKDQEILNTDGVNQDGTRMKAQLRFVLGNGGTGTVYACEVDGYEGMLAIKVYNFSKDSCDKVRHEVSIYQHLIKLQGMVIPECISSGIMVDESGDRYESVL